VQPQLGFEEGEVNMFVMDMPDLPPQYAQVMLVQASQSQPAKYDRTIGICQAIENPPHPDYPQGSAVNSMQPVGELRQYFRKQEKQKLEGPSTVNVLEMPKHGELKDQGTFVITHGAKVDTGERGYSYLPSPGYLGDDRAVLQVEIAGMKIKVVYSFHVVESMGNDANEIFCGPSRYKRLSVPSNSDPLAAQDPVQLTSFLTGAVNANLAFSDLPGTAVGQTTANTITLDLDAAGHGWFIDATPYDNSEFLPTSDPNVWVAKPGSSADGKMDMLTVLLHEYGHVLGLDHSADANDLMGANLQPGVRHTIGTEVYEQIWSLAGDSGPFDPRAPLPPSLPLGLPLGLPLLFGLGRMRLQGAEPKGVSLPPLEADPNAFEATPTPIYRMQPMYETALHTGIYNGGELGYVPCYCDNTTPRHVPDKVLQVGDIPRTKSGKIVELAVREVVHGRAVKNLEALANPEALEEFRGRAELET
jgi:hypothetical protein